MIAKICGTPGGLAASRACARRRAYWGLDDVSGPHRGVAAAEPGESVVEPAVPVRAQSSTKVLRNPPKVDKPVPDPLSRPTSPWDAVSDLGAVWNWDAGTSVEGDDVDECPESGPDWRNPKMEQFPSIRTSAIRTMLRTAPSARMPTTRTTGRGRFGPGIVLAPRAPRRRRPECQVSPLRSRGRGPRPG